MRKRILTALLIAGLVFAAGKTSSMKTYAAGKESTNSGTTDNEVTDNEDTTEEESVTHKITYNLNGGSNHLSNPEAYEEGVGTLLYAPVRNGYQFEGWYLDLDFENKVEEISTTENEDIEVFAKWKLCTYKITYQLGGGVNNGKNPVNYTILSNKVVLQNPTRSEYYFTGWYLNNKKVTTIAANSTGNLTLTAKWSKYSQKVYLKKDINIYKTSTGKDKLESAAANQLYYSAGVKVGSYTAVMNVKTKRTGFVLTSQITTKKPTTDIVRKTKTHYDYKTMESNLKKLAKTYPQWMQLNSLGKTVDNRQIYCVVVGNKNAKKQMVVTASMHAREYLNTYFIMDQIEYYMNNYQKKSGKINLTYEQLFNDVALYIVPMVNPDGVQISQYGVKGLQSKKLQNNLKKMLKRGGSTKTWKANANGVNLNRNFKPGWRIGSPSRTPNYSSYAGKSGGSEKETKAVVKLYESLKNPVVSIAYHSMGNIVDYDMSSKSKYAAINKKMVNTVVKLTNYKKSTGDLAGGIGGTLGDYLERGKMQMPNLTIETGNKTCPLPYSYYSRLWKDNRYVIESVAKLFY